MLTESDFENLLNKSESTTLDFKKDFYDFSNDNNKQVTSKFVKDVISFSNTIRTENAYIIFGVKELESGELNLVGISKKVDDAILQEKVKSKVTPRPVFLYYSIKYQGKLFGVLEFPVTKYEMPIIPIVSSLKGLDPEKVYYRNGTSNTEASPYDVIRINDWLRRLPQEENPNSINDDISKYLTELTKNEHKLSVIISELLQISKKHNLQRLKEFCEDQIKGINSGKTDGYGYRTQKVHISWNKVEINPYSIIKPTAQSMKNDFDNHKEFFDFKLILQHPIIEIENLLERIGNNPDFYLTFKTDTVSALDMERKRDLYIYLFAENIIMLYKNIRQKAIDLLMEI
ncbi:ATP-binding protein [Aquimarina sp. W85]|uniref:ATP-binding protein n=1 Tax=Aquimarina rhodophyticola TaxID=3342246 RepID=UPI003671F8A7